MQFLKSKFLISKKIWSVLSSSERSRASILLGLLLIGMVLETIGISLVIPAIALFTQDDIASTFPILEPLLVAMGSPSHEEQVKWGLIILLTVYFIKNLFLAFLVWLQMSFSSNIGARLSKNLYSIYLRQPYKYHLKHNSAILLRNIYTEVNVFTGALNSFLVLLSESFVLIALCLMLFIVEPLSASAVVVILGLSVAGFYRFTRNQIASWGVGRQHHEGYRIQHAQQGLGGVKDSILLGREKDFINEYSIHNDKSFRIARNISTLKQMPRLALEVLAVGGIVIVFLVMMAQGRPISSILPVLAFFAVTAFRLMPSANRILGAVQDVHYHLPVINVLHKDINLSTSNNQINIKPSFSFDNSIEISKIAYKYDNSDEPVIKDMSFKVKFGHSIGFIGPSGSGKSTLVDILLGLLKPTRGQINVDGVDIKNNLRGWQNKIGYVPQSIYLTDDTLRRNVAFGLSNENINEDSIKRAIKAAQLEDFIKELPDGLDTVVGEHGVRLSGGQRQRIGIARALYHDPTLLVLDEATSSLDIETEVEVMKAIEALHGKKTIFIVAHRLSTVENCDYIYKLEKGLVVDEGTSKQILKS